MLWPWDDLTLFAAGAGAITLLSLKPLRHPGSHGFYRYFGWLGILALVTLNHRAWGMEPFSPHQMMAWPLLLASVVLVTLGFLTLLRLGRASCERGGGSLYAWERTTALVNRGIFAHIRHPMYASLLALTWGAYLQAPSWPGAAAAVSASASFVLTALSEERECIAYFGRPYEIYMRRTWRFLPGIH